MKNLKYVTGAFSVTLSLVLASFLAFTAFKSYDVYGTKRTVVICILVAYAIFRAYRLISDYLKERRNENNFDD